MYWQISSFLGYLILTKCEIRDKNKLCYTFNPSRWQKLVLYNLQMNFFLFQILTRSSVEPLKILTKKKKQKTLFCTHHHHHQAKTVVSLRFKKKYASKEVRISKICLFCRFTTGTTGINSKLNIKSVNEKCKIFNFKL